MNCSRSLLIPRTLITWYSFEITFVMIISLLPSKDKDAIFSLMYSSSSKTTPGFTSLVWTRSSDSVKLTNQRTVGASRDSTRTNQKRAWTSADEYCNSPDREIAGDEGRASASYRLEQVQVLIRHGDRAGMAASADQAASLSCQLAAASPHELAYLTYLSRHGHTRPRGPFQTRALYPRAPVCAPAQLTPLGARQHLKLGLFLQQAYIRRFSLLSDDLDAAELLLRSTPAGRTYQSAIALLHGFLPDFRLSRLYFTESPASFCSHDLYPCSCSQLPQLQLKHRHLIAKLRRQHSQTHKNIFMEIVKPHFPKAEVIGTRSLLDSIMTSYCHSKPFCERCNETKVLETLWMIENTVMRNISSHPDVIRNENQYMQPFLHEIHWRMHNRTFYVTNRSKQRFILYSGHDVTISSLATVLGLHSNQGNSWPRFASRLVLELWSSVRSDQAKYYFRLIWDGSDVTDRINFCTRFLRSGMCPLWRLSDFVNQLNNNDFGAKRKSCTS